MPLLSSNPRGDDGDATHHARKPCQWSPWSSFSAASRDNGPLPRRSRLLGSRAQASPRIHREKRNPKQTMITNFLLLFALAFPLPQAPTPDTFILKSKEVLNGSVVSVQGEKVKLQISVMGGTATVTRNLADFTPTSAYIIRASQAKADSFADHLELAKFCVGNGLVKLAGKECRAARDIAEKAADGGAQRKQLGAWVADTLEGLFKKAVADNDRDLAQRYLNLINTHVPEERTDAQREALADMLQAAEDNVRAERDRAAADKASAAEQKEREKKLEPIFKQIQNGEKAQREATVNASKSSVAKGKYETAFESYRRAWQAAQALLKANKDEEWITEAVGEIGQRLHKNAVATCLGAANALTIQSDYKNALEWTNKILVFDPDNSEAKDMIRHIQTVQASASSGWGQGWGR
jgi:tetratricopeptide (TPR) repeat protein